METRIKLINCTKEIIDAIKNGDGHLSKLLEIKVPEKWSKFGRGAFQYTLKEIEQNPTIQKWLTYLPVLIESNTLIGSCGFKGFPDEEGMVEIGYEVALNFRNKGYATEMATLLVQKAFIDPKVKKVQAHTLANINASVQVLRKCNFEKVNEIEDLEDGRIWKWELKK